jgi:ankyrin repeat protein
MNMLSIVALLLAQVKAPDASARLFDAIGRGDAGAVRGLMAADPGLEEARNRDGATAVLWSVYTKHAELAPILLSGRQPDFFEACALGRRDRAAELLHGDSGMARAHSADGFSGLGLALFFGKAEVARMLVDAGADVNEPSHNAIRVAPLHSAVASGQVGLVELLLAHGARPDPVEFLGATPLHAAAAEGRSEMVQRLMAAGADPRRLTKAGKTAADLAREAGHPQVALLLEGR